MDEAAVICGWCGHQARLVWVHGHGQCAVCGTNADECCRGEQCAREEGPWTR